MTTHLPHLTPNLKPDDKVLIIGRTGCGKTTLVKHLLSSIKKYIIYDTVGEYGDLAPEAENLLEFFEYIEAQEPRLVYFTDRDSEFDKICRIVYALSKTYFVVDEIDNFCKSNYTPDYLTKVIRYGRKYNIGLIFVTRRPAEVSRLLTSQASKIISFTQHEPNDIKYLAPIIPGSERILTLPRFSLLYYDVLNHKSKIIQLPKP